MVGLGYEPQTHHETLGMYHGGPLKKTVRGLLF